MKRIINKLEWAASAFFQLNGSYGMTNRPWQYSNRIDSTCPILISEQNHMLYTTIYQPIAIH